MVHMYTSCVDFGIPSHVYVGNRDDAILKYHYGYPKVQPLCVIAYFQARDGLERLKCQLWVGGNYTEKNCKSNNIHSCNTYLWCYSAEGSEGYVAFYFEDYGDKRPYRLHIEGHSGEQETYTLSTTFHLGIGVLTMPQRLFLTTFSQPPSPPVGYTWLMMGSQYKGTPLLLSGVEQEHWTTWVITSSTCVELTVKIHNHVRLFQLCLA